MKLLGQKPIFQYLLHGFQKGKLSPSLFFSGPEGVGKKAFALELAKSWACQNSQSTFFPSCQNCSSCLKISSGNHPDLLLVNFELQAEIFKEKIDKQNVLKIDTIRQALRFLTYRPTESQRRVLIIEDADLMTIDAANAMLKMLEEPPRGSQIVLVGKNPKNLPSTILSRCAHLVFQPIPAALLAGWLMETHGEDEGRAKEIANLSKGSFSKALELLEEDPVEADLDDFELDEFFASTSDPGFRKGGKKNAASLLNHLIEKNQSRLEKGDFSRASELKAMLAARAQLDRYVPPRLVLENLFLKIQKRRNQSPV